MPNEDDIIKRNIQSLKYTIKVINTEIDNLKSELLEYEAGYTED